VKKYKAITLSLLLTLIGVFGLLTFNQTLGAQRVRLNVRDLSEHQLKAISPTDASFDALIEKIGPNSSGQKQFVESLKPYSIIIRNESSRDVVAYRVRWDAVTEDGTTTTQVITYAEPDRLMGEGPNSIPGAPPKSAIAIRANSLRYVSIIQSIDLDDKEGPDPRILGGISAISSSGDASQIKRFGQEKDEQALMEQLRNELANSVSLTITLDVAVFADGTFVGPDSFHYFGQLTALIQAKGDLLREALSGAQNKRALDSVFSDLQSFAGKEIAPVPQSATPSDYYTFYKKKFANEILRIRAAIGDDKQAFSHVTRPLSRQWPLVHKKP
jgi:hypothetical protein